MPKHVQASNGRLGIVSMFEVTCAATIAAFVALGLPFALIQAFAGSEPLVPEVAGRFGPLGDALAGCVFVVAGGVLSGIGNGLTVALGLLILRWTRREVRVVETG